MVTILENHSIEFLKTQSYRHQDLTNLAALNNM